MEATSVQVKLEYENALRRVTVARNESLARLKANIGAMLGVNAQIIRLTYRDDENDLVTIGSDLELQELLADFAAQQNKILRLIVVTTATDATEFEVPQAQVAPDQGEPRTPAESAAPSQPQQQDAAEFAWANLARALSDPEVVRRVQTAFQSPIITETVVRAASGYTDSKGDVMLAGLMAAQQVPMLLGLLAELLEDLPVLRDLQQLIATWVSQAMASGDAPQQARAPGGPPFFPPPFFPGMFGGPRPPFPGGHGPHHPHHPFHPGGHHHPGHHPGAHHHPGPHHHAGPHHHPGAHHHPGHRHGPDHHHPHHQPQKHFGVFCDGCGSDDALRQVSIAAGHQSRRGFIRGLRYKSQTVQDFDLCESCKKAEGRFPDDIYGPFAEITPPADQQHPRGGRGCGGGWWRAQQNQGNWRCGVGAANASCAPNAAAAEKKEQQPKEEFDFVEAIRSAVVRGTEAFAAAAKNDSNDFSDIARAIAESLKQDESAKAAPAEEKLKAATPSAPPAAAVVPEQKPEAAKPQSNDPFVKWSKQLSQLEALGFDRPETYFEFLEQEHGDLDRVVARIVSRDL